MPHLPGTPQHGFDQRRERPQHRRSIQHELSDPFGRRAAEEFLEMGCNGPKSVLALARPASDDVHPVPPQVGEQQPPSVHRRVPHDNAHLGSGDETPNLLRRRGDIERDEIHDDSIAGRHGARGRDAFPAADPGSGAQAGPEDRRERAVPRCEDVKRQ